MKRPVRQDLKAIGFVGTLDAVVQRTKKITTALSKLTGVLALVFLAYGVQAQTLSTDDFNGTFCPGQTFNVNYTASGNFGGSNNFTAFISNNNFTTLVQIGTKAVSGVQGNGSVPVTIPYNLAAGNNYRIRVVSTSAPVRGILDDNFNNLTISALNTTVSDPAGPFCAGDPITVNFSTSCALASGNTFTLQLSDKTGSFASPSNIGFLSNTTSGSNTPISGNIPSGVNSVPYGTGYKVRVVSSNPNSNITWNANAGTFKITSGKLTNLKTSPGTYCPGEALAPTFTFAPGEVFLPGNVFSLQMSDASGSFASPTVIGTLASTALTGSINGIIPYVVAGGTNYKFRIVSSSPQTESCESSPYTIPKIRAFTDPSNDLKCAGQAASFTVSGLSNNATYQWQKVCSNPFVMRTAGLGSNVVFDVAKNGANVYAATGTDLSISRNSGSTFTENKLAGNTVNAVATGGGNYVYAATGAGLWVSTNNGTSFTQFTTANGLPTQNVFSVAGSGNTIYAGTTGGFVKSTNGGANFGPVLFTDVPFDVFLSGNDVYVATGGGLKVSNDAGATFVTYNVASNQLPSNNVQSVFAKDGVIYAGTDNGFAYSINGGANFITVSAGLGGLTVNKIFVSGGRVYAATTGGLSVLNPGGTAFTNIVTGITNLNLTGLVVDGNDVYLSTFGGVAKATFTSMDLTAAGPASSSTFNIASVTPADSWCRFQVVVTQGGCSLTSNQVRVSDIPPVVTDSITGTKTCNGTDGRIKIKGLVPGTMYSVFYTQPSVFAGATPANGTTAMADPLGSLEIKFLKAGTYSNVYVKSLLDNNCESNRLTSTILDPPVPAKPVVAQVADVCLGQNITIKVNSPSLQFIPATMTTPLKYIEEYRWFTDANGNFLANPSSSISSTYSPAVPPQTAGTGSIYLRVRNIVTLCNSEITKVDYTVKSAPQISCMPTQPSTVNATDGKITIKAPNPEPGPYKLEYKTPNGTLVSLTNISLPYDITGLGIGDYTEIKVTNNNGTGCPSNIINSCPLVGPPRPDGIGGKPRQTVACGNKGVKGGYFQQVTDGTCATPDLIDEDKAAIAVGRIRQTKATPPNPNEKVEMRGYVQFDLSAIPKNATIDKVEFRPKSIQGGFTQVCDIDINNSNNTGAAGDLKFDITQVNDKNYAPYVGFTSPIFDDLFDTKYNDFVIGSNATGALTDLGAQAVIDAQRRLLADGKFEIGLTLSGTDFEIPVYQFNGIVFAPSAEQELCITYHLNDFGDLPEPRYATDLAGGLVGPSHRADLVDNDPSPATQLVPALYIGATPADAEVDGQVDDNANGTADEDLSLASFSGKLIAGEPVTLTVPVTNNVPQPAKLSVFIDWDGDGVFNNATERYDRDVLPAAQANSTVIPTPYTNSFVFNLTVPQLPTSYVIGVRVRLTTGQVFDAYGPAPDGEVEDFLMDFQSLDYGDLPDATNNGTVAKVDDYQTRRADNGARHAVPGTPLVFLGQKIDTESDGVPSILGDGDDKNNINFDDEDGIKFITSPLIPGQPATIEFTATNNSTKSATLYLYADFNNDGINTIDPIPVVFTVPGDAVVAAGTVTRQLTFTMPLNADYNGDKATFRFRFTTDANPSPQGLAQDGEVEDYISSDLLLYDWADLEEPKYITDVAGGVSGPNHRIRYIDVDPSPVKNYKNSLYIGATPPDAEKDGKPTHLANGDDNIFIDDEDLSPANFLNPTTNTPYPLLSSEPIRLRIPIVNNSSDKAATVWAYIDWNSDGDFVDAGEQVSRPVPANFNGNIDFDLTIPLLAKSDSIGVRIRTTTGSIIDAYGKAIDGEVEDFVVEVRALDYGDLPDLTAGTAPSDYQTFRARNGARHGVPVVPLVYIGTNLDTEVDGQPNAKSTGDDQNPQAGPDDEDGIKFLTPLVPGYTSRVAFTGRNGTNVPAKLYIYTDWTNDGILDLATTYTLPANSAVLNQPISFYVPASATFKGGNAFFRFRLTTDVDFNAAPSANGVAVDGEVEDYYVPVFKLGNLVWEDRNNNGFQDAEEIQLGIKNVRVVLRFGGINPLNGTCDEVTQKTNYAPDTLASLGAGADIIDDFVIDTFTNAKGLYTFTGMIEGYYQIIALDTFGLTPTRFDWIKNVTEEDRDSDGKPLKNPWDYLSGERRQSKSQQFKMLEGLIGTDEEGILDQGNPQLLDPNELEGYPDNKVEQRIDFGYVGLDLGDLAESGNNPSVTKFTTTENGTKPEGPKHIVTPDLRLGTCQDVEWLGQPDQDAGSEFKPGPDGGGDDPIANFKNYPNFPYDPSQGRRWPFHDSTNVCGDDEDGIKFLTPMVAGYDAIISVKYSAKLNFNGPDAYLHAWIDWNGDGDFDNGAGIIDANEHIIFNKLDGKVVPNLLEANTQAVKLEMSYLTSATDSITLTFKVPADVKYNNGNILARFRLSYDPQLGPNGILAPNLNFPDPQPGAGNSTVPGGIIPYGEVEDYFIALSKVGNLVFEDRDYDGFQDDLEPGIANVPIKLEFAGADGILNNGDPYEFTYLDTTDANGRYYFCGLIGNVDPSGIPNPVYRIIVSDPAGMTATFNNPDPSDDACIDDNSNGDDLLIDNRITADTFTITNPMNLCLDENERNDVGGLVAGNNLPPSADALNNFPDNQYDETRDFGYAGFDYGDLPTTVQKKGSYYQTLRDSMDAKFSGKFGARAAIQPRLYLGRGVDGELNGKPDADAGSLAGGDDDDQGLFKKGTRTTDDETGVRLLSPLLPGEKAYIKVTYTSQDTSGTGTNGTGYVNRTAYLDAFIDWNGNGVMDIPAEKVLFTHQTNSAGALSTNNVPALGTPTRTPALAATGSNGVDSTILAFTVPNDAVFDTGVVFMRFRLGWTNYAASFPTAFPNGLGADNNIFHMTKSPYVKAYQNNLPFNPPVSFNDVAGDAGRYPYPQGEVEDYGIPVAKIGNLAWFDHDVFGDQDLTEDVVDSLQLVLIWGGLDAATGVFDTVGYFKNLISGGNITDIQYNRTIAPPAVGTYTPGALVKTGISPAADSGLYSFRGLIPGIYYVLPLKYFAADSATFVNAWPKHRVVTLQDNPGVDDNNDSDGLTSGLPGTSNRPGAMVRIRDGNSRDPEVLVNDRPLNENGKRDADDNASPFTTALFPDNQWDKSVDIGWVDEPNVEANLDIVGVNFPTSQICGNFNVITHLCIKNPQEVPLDSLQMFFNLKDAYGNALYTLTKPVVTIVDSAYVLNPKNIKVKKSSLVNYASAVNAKAKNLLTVNPNYDGVNDIRLLLPTAENKDFLLRGDSILCVQIEFEIDPTKTDKYPWMLQAATTARAIGFNKQTGGKRPLTDFRMFSPRYGKSISVYDLSDEFNDPMPMAGVPYPTAGDGIIFEGMVADRGFKGTYQTPYSAPNVTGRDKYADENDKTIQNDECWLKTKWNSGQNDIVVGLDANCKAIVNGDIVAPTFNDTCGFNKYPMGSYYRVIIQDKLTGQTLWASVDRVPFDMSQYLDRELIYKVRSVSNFCFPVWGNIKLEDKVPPVVTCPKNTDRKVGGTYQFVCTDIDSVLNVQKSWTNTGYGYYTGIATAVDACGTAILDNVLDRVVYFADCKEQADNKYVYARITRVFTFRDANDNKAQCTQYIDFYRPFIQLPACKIEVQNNLAKGDTLVLPKDLVGKYGVPDGVPYYINGSGKRVYLLATDICGIAYSYKDNIQFVTGQGKCGKKIIRSWSLFDWCYSTDRGYPNFLIKPTLDASCYASAVWSGGRYNWEQIIIVGDDTPPVIYALDTDNDKKIGNGYAGAPKADPKVETPTYDPGDVLTFSTGPMDCTGSFVFNKNSFRVDETTDWCYSIQVFERYAVLDLDERPTGVYIMRQNPGVKVTGDCAKGYQVTGVPAKGDWFVEVTVRNACLSVSTALLPIDIVDKIAPVMKCDDQLNVTLDNVGTGYITAKNMDEGSWDNCGPLKWIKVRRPVPEGCFSTFLKSWRVIDVNKDGKIGAKDNKEDYIDLNRNGKADASEYFTISSATKMLMTPLMDTIPAYCCDGDSLIVELWGEDLVGNQNYCWHKVKLDDKTPIVCMPPLNVTIKCTDKNFALIKDAKASAKIWGDVLIMSGNTCTKADTAYSIKENLKCGYGTIERIWTLSKKTSKGIVKTVCSQIITVLPVHEYNICFPKDAIQKDCKKPIVDTVLTNELGCDILAVNVSDKRYNASDDECYKIFRTYTVINWCTYDDRCGDAMDPDNVYVVDRKWGEFGVYPTYILARDASSFFNKGEKYFNEGDNVFFVSRDTIPWNLRPDASKLRDGVIDNNGNDETIYPTSACKGWTNNRRRYRDYDGDYHDYFIHSWMYTQIIKVYDDVRPEVVVPKLAPFCIDPSKPCLATVKINYKAKDNCSNVIEVQNHLFRIAPFQTQDAGATVDPSTFDKTWTSGAVGKSTDSFTVTIKNLPEGTHDLIVYVRDECGNLSLPTRIPFTVKDCKAPVPICINGLSTDLMPDGKGSGAMTVWAKDFIASPAYDCNGQGPETKDGLKLITKYSINRVGKPKDVNSTSLVVSCDDKNKQVLVEIHAWDEKGNDDFCVTYITVGDNNKVCPGAGSAGGDGEIAGLINTETNQPVQGVSVELSGKSINSMSTATDGKYSFTGLQKGYDYSVTPNLDANPLNGVSTFDLVLMQKHILGIEILNSPYKLIAADINNSKSITTLDLILLRKLILNLDTKFTSNTSWRFVDASYSFPDPTNPWSAAFPEITSINNLNAKVNANFIAIKMGDVNGNASPNAAAAAEVRKVGKLEMQAEEQALQAGSEYTVTVRAKDLAKIQGYQFTMELDRNKVEIAGIDYGVAKAENFGVFKREGVITTSWNRKAGAENGDAILFTLKLKAVGAGSLSEALKVSSRYTANEAYNEAGDFLTVALNFGSSNLASVRPELLQNTPNPFAEQTQIGFFLPEASEARLTIRDAKGSIVYRLKANYSKGWSQVTIKQSDLKAAGVLYYSLDTPNFTDTKKMVLLNR